MTKIIQADLQHLDIIAPLFDSYRQFYEQEPDLPKARAFVEARLAEDESVIFLALDEDGNGLGFTQLYPSYCSVEAQHVWLLYDLFVAPEARRKGVGKKLMDEAKALGIESGAAWLKLDTAITNIPAQSLYENLGWEREEEFYAYFLQLPD